MAHVFRGVLGAGPRSGLKKILWILVATPLLVAAASAEEGLALPPCLTQNGREVLVARAKPELLQQAYVKLAFSMVDAGRPVLLLDVSALAMYPVQFQNFVYLHECTHHERGHVSEETRLREMVLRQIEADRELQAD